jgi:hypothetical protein
MNVRFELVGSITDVEVIAAGPGLQVCSHWYEAHGIGKKDLKIKRYLDES